MELWAEYKFGISGRKAAQKFTFCQRNSFKALKQKYWRQNQVWMIMAGLVNCFWSPGRRAIKIWKVYGFKARSVSKIIPSIISDKKRYIGGINPNLVV